MGVVPRWFGSWWGAHFVRGKPLGRAARLRTRGWQVVRTAGNHRLYCRGCVPSTVFCGSEPQTRLEKPPPRRYARSKGCPVASIHRESEEGYSRKPYSSTRIPVRYWGVGKRACSAGFLEEFFSETRVPASVILGNPVSGLPSSRKHSAYGSCVG